MRKPNCINFNNSNVEYFIILGPQEDAELIPEEAEATSGGSGDFSFPAISSYADDDGKQ